MISIKICDLCDTCVYGGEYTIIDGDIVCCMCEEEMKEEIEENIIDEEETVDSCSRVI